MMLILFVLNRNPNKHIKNILYGLDPKIYLDIEEWSQ